MPIRTTVEKVTGIVEVCDDIDVDPFIEAAAFLIDKIVEPSSTSTVYPPVVVYDEMDLELIERWLAAHFYTIRDNRIDTEKVDTASEKLRYKVDLGLDQTQYGQKAKLLDVNGALARWDSKSKQKTADADATTTRTASVRWAGGKPRSY